jgi:cytochrome c biogenesis protein CcdA
VTGTLVLAGLAGLLSVLSPCVVPLLPIVLGAAAAEHRLAPVALALGVSLSFVAIGLFFATIGLALPIDGDTVRLAAAVVMMAAGIFLLVPPLGVRLATAAGPLGHWTDAHLGSFSRAGLWGQFGVGLLLGAVWSPCVGPTLGAASSLAAQGRDLGQVAATMAVFGIGAAVPLLVMGLLARGVLMRWRARMLQAASALKMALGAALACIGLIILTGVDHRVEAALVAASPGWLTTLTTRF